jgi:hypothetical protein
MNTISRGGKRYFTMRKKYKPRTARGIQFTPHFLFCCFIFSPLIAGHLRDNESDNKADRHGNWYQDDLGHAYFPEKKP